MILWTAFILGLAGSLHCAGMCGPLVMAMPGLAGDASGSSPGRYLWRSRTLYNGGRVATYAALGVVFGLVGQTAAWAGWQRWVSLAAGIAIVVGLLLSRRYVLGLPAARFVARIKPWFGTLLRRRSGGSVFVLGMLNGLLPCGLVYAAGAGAMAAGSLEWGILFMVVFGLGTWPMMFGLGWLGARAQTALRFRLQRWVPASLLVVAALLIVRGLALDIPYLSPGPLDQAGACPACVSHEQPQVPGKR